MHPSDSSHEWDRIAAYLLGDSEPGGRVAFERWLVEDPSLRDIIEATVRGIVEFERTIDETGVEPACDRLREAILAQRPEHALQERLIAADANGGVVGYSRGLILRGVRRWVPVIGVAAAVAAVWLANRSGRPTASKAALVYTARTGERATLRLVDGTRVILGPQTTVRIDPGFDEAHRAVTLTGEAYFDVARAAGQPFVVRAGGVASRVLGTQFVIRHYAADPDVRVAVVSGRVMSGWHTPLVLSSRMVASFTDSTAVVGTGADLREYVEWTSGRLAFTKASVAEVVATLGRWYGLEFRFADPALATRHITAVFDYNARQEVLQTLQLMLGVHMTFQDTVVTLVPGRAAAPSRPIRGVHDEVDAKPTEVGR